MGHVAETLLSLDGSEAGGEGADAQGAGLDQEIAMQLSLDDLK